MEDFRIPDAFHNIPPLWEQKVHRQPTLLSSFRRALGPVHRPAHQPTHRPAKTIPASLCGKIRTCHNGLHMTQCVYFDKKLERIIVVPTSMVWRGVPPPYSSGVPTTHGDLHSWSAAKELCLAALSLARPSTSTARLPCREHLHCHVVSPSRHIGKTVSVCAKDETTISEDLLFFEELELVFRNVR